MICAVGAYVLWGVLPVYWKALQAVPAVQILSHRIIWSCLFLGALVVLRQDWASFRTAAGNSRTVLLYTLSAALLSGNWLTYIWAVNSGHIVETSLGYYMNPLVSVLLAVLVLREHLTRLQWVATALAGIGVGYLTYRHGRLPWIALMLAFSFAFYGLLKKQAPLGALHGLSLETAILVLPALGYVILGERHHTGSLGQAGWGLRLLLAGTGVVTALPLLLFAHAARTTKLSTLGILQYASPTCALVLGIVVYHEPFPVERLIGFGIIWVALLVFTLDSVLRFRRLRP